MAARAHAETQQTRTVRSAFWVGGPCRVAASFLRKLPRQADSSKVEFSASFPSLNMVGGIFPSASCGRSSL